MGGLVLIKQKQGNFDSNYYSDFYNLELPQNSDKWLQFVTETVELMLQNDLQDMLIIADNYLYGVFGLIFKNIYASYEIPKINVYILPEQYQHIAETSVMNVEDYYFQMEYDKPRLFHYQVHLTDVCNLKCKGCGHYCNLTEEHNYLDINSYKSDILKIREKFWGVERIQLLGGEPLLNPFVGDVVSITREVFPDADIRVTTNGLLLPKMKEDFWKSVKENHAHIEISLYKPTKEHWTEIYGSIVENGVADATIVWEQKDQFFKSRVLNENPNFIEAFKNCLSNKCYFLRDGKIYLCPVVYLNKFFYEKMNLEMPYEPVGINLYDENLDGWEIVNELKKPCVGCKYCSEKLEWFDWEVCNKDKAKLEDWVV